jgi:MFS family permease
MAELAQEGHRRDDDLGADEQGLHREKTNAINNKHDATQQQQQHQHQNQQTPDVEAAPVIKTELEPQDSDDNEPRKITGITWFLTCLSLYVAALNYGLDTTIAADIQGAVIETFAEASALAWVGAAFPLGSVAVILPYGALYANFNQKWLYIAGIVLFEAGSALCGGAPDMNALVVGRVVAGIGGTGMYLGGLNYFTALTTPTERGLYIAGIGFAWGFGAVLGPVVGGGFSDSSATWRWSFYINLVLVSLSDPALLLNPPSSHLVTDGTDVNRLPSRLLSGSCACPPSTPSRASPSCLAYPNWTT